MTTKSLTEPVFAGLFGLLALVLTATLVLACESTEESGGGDDEPGEPVQAVLTAKSAGDKERAHIQMTLPPEWEKDDNFGDWMPKGARMMDVSLRASLTCGGMCDPSKLPENIEESMDAAVNNLRTVAAKDGKFDTTVEVLEEGDLPLGRFIAYELRYNEPPGDRTHQRPGVTVECFLYEEGDERYVHVRARAVPGEKDTVWPAIKDACETAQFVEEPTEDGTNEGGD